MAPAGLRSSFAPDGALVPFYTGGPARLSPDGRVLAAACGDDAQLVDAAGTRPSGDSLAGPPV